MILFILCSTLLVASLSINLPVIDISSLLNDPDGAAARRATDAIQIACEETGFFYISNTGVSEYLVHRLEASSHYFFSGKTVEEKERIAMKYSGRAWRGYFKVGDELTSGKQDMKEGIYFGKEEPDYTGSMPLRGPNLFPVDDNGDVLLKEEVLEYMGLMRQTGIALMRAITNSLGKNGVSLGDYFMEDPTELFRIFSYPAPVEKGEEEEEDNVDDDVYGVGEHTDYGFLTILHQDSSGGLQVKVREGGPGSELQWLDVPPIPGTFVVNLGDALEHYTHGKFLATPHRVIYHGRADTHGEARLSFPYFFDPSWEAPMSPMVLQEGEEAHDSERWDGADPKQFEGFYGEYLQRKISKVFPQLFANSLTGEL